MDGLTTGLSLKILRVSARVKAKDLADHMGVSPSRIASIEREQFPSRDSVARYRAALQKCRNVPHTPAAA